METIINYTGLVIGLILAVIGIILQIRSSKRKELYWSENSTNLIKGYSSMFSDLEVTYKNKKIENLTISKIVIWNGGNETVDRSDIETAQPLVIAALDDETEILDIKPLAISNKANDFSTVLGENGKLALLRFDYLNSGQGAVLQVIHTGNTPSNLFVIGEVKGVKEIKYKSTTLPSHLRMVGAMIYVYLGMLVGFSILYGTETFQNSSAGPVSISFRIGVIIVTAILAITWGYAELKRARRTAKLPLDLRIFEKDIDKNIK